MPTNRERADIAQEAVESFAILAGSQDEPLSDNITDLLTNLRHLCHQNRISFGRAMFMSEIHFEMETGTKEGSRKMSRAPTS